MHKKDYNNFARMIRSQRHQIIKARLSTTDDEKPFMDGAEKQLSIIIDELVTIFKADNDKFDADKFYSACEIEKESEK